MDAKELLDKYVNRELNAQERAQVKSLIKEDPEFKKEFVRETAMAATMRAREKAKLKQELRGFLKDIKPDDSSTTQEAPKAKVVQLGTRRIVMAIAASLTLLLVSYFAFMNQATDYSQIYADNYRVYRAGINPTRDTNETLHPAAQAYVEGDFQQAIAGFNQLVDISDTELEPTGLTADALQLYLGNAYLNTKQYEQAVKAFQHLLTMENTALTQDARWYLALTYLKMEKKEDATRLLQEITAGKSIYVRDAKKILEEL